MNFVFNKSLVLVLPFVAFVAFSASATTPAQSSSGGVRTLTWEEFRASCEDPARFQAQRPPERITISCADHVTTWVPDGDTSVGLSEDRQIQGSLISDKYLVQSEAFALPRVLRSASCPRFKEVVRSFTYEQLVECPDLRQFHGTLREFCLSTLDAALAANPRLATEQDTGRTLDLCAASSSPKQY